jgi:ubiquinone/menaquinone biosynthesis C-methylase UbiE
MPDRSRARELAAEFNRKGDPTGWFELLYREGKEGKSVVPWADLRPNPHLLDFWKLRPQAAPGKSALAVGSGLGDDAEQLADWGYQTTAFDISETAVRGTLERFPSSPVEYLAADVLNLPQSWHHRFDFVLEIYTLQVFPAAIRPQAIEKIAHLVKPGGLLLVIARGRNPHEPEGQMPWPLARNEFQGFTNAGLTEESFEEFQDAEDPSVRRFRALYKRPLK